MHTPFSSNEMNQVAPSQVQVIDGRYFWPLTGGVKQNANESSIFGILFDGSAHYNGLLTQVKVSQYHGLTAQATYTRGVSAPTTVRARRRRTTTPTRWRT